MPNFCESDKNYGLDYSNPKQEIYKMVHNKKTGEEQLKVVEEIDIEEQLKEQQDIVEAYIEITKAEVENRKAENLIDMKNDSEFMQELENASNTMNDENIYTIMDYFQTINRVFENLPKVEKEKFKTPQEFVKKGLKDFINNAKKEKQEEIVEVPKQTELEEKIKQLEQELKTKGETKTNEAK